MMNFFSIPAQDQSLFYLASIFGVVGNVLPASAATNASMIMGVMFKVLNTMALTIAAFIVVYITIVGMLATAHEGEFLGKKWSGLWVPIRTALGIAALFPMPSGYSAIQIMAMWIIVQGIGAADTLWNAVLKYKSAAGSIYASPSVASVSPAGASGQMPVLFQSLVCQASARADYNPVGNINYFCANNSPDRDATFCSKDPKEMLNIQPQNDAVTTYSIGPNGNCGLLTFCNLQTACSNPNSDDCYACKGQRAGLQAIVATFGAIAAKFVEVDHDYLQFWYAPPAKPNDKQAAIPGWIKNYCTNKGVDAAKCNSSSPIFNSLTPIESADADASDISANVIKNLYLPFPLTDFLGKNTNFIDDAVSAYIANVVAGVVSNVTQKSQPLTISDQYGWIYAGRYYYQLASSNQKTTAAANLGFSMATTGASGGYPNKPLTPCGNKPDSKCTAYRINYNGINNLFGAISPPENQTFGNPAAGAVISGTKGTLLRTFAECLTQNTCQGASCGSEQNRNTNPLVSIATFGYQLMITAQVLFLTVAGLIMAIVGLSSLNWLSNGWGLTSNPAGEMWKAGISYFSPLIFALVVSLFTLGGILGIYVPLIPFIIFTMGALGWILAVIEAMVAAPLVALGLLGPGGQHEILGRAEPAMMLIFNVFLRPSLMIFGLIAAMLVSIAIIKLINSGFLSLTEDIIANPGLFEEILFIAAYTGIIVAALNKTFSLIHIIPERVLTWIGGPAVQYGEGEALGAVKHGVEGGAGAAAGGLREATGTVAGSTKAVKEAKMQEKGPPKKPEVSAASTTGSPSGGSPSGGTGT